MSTEKPQARGIAAMALWRSNHPKRWSEIMSEAARWRLRTEAGRAHLRRIQAMGAAASRRPINWSDVRSLLSAGLSWRRVAHSLKIPPATLIGRRRELRRLAP